MEASAETAERWLNHTEIRTVDAASQFAMGMRLTNGDGLLDKDLTQAAGWFVKAANQARASASVVPNCRALGFSQHSNLHFTTTGASVRDAAAGQSV